ncbi:MAG: E3 binding domain-containing protein [Armatimonadetes bacterium]|nr:E3 binding domain-containing protein [Armatimonadota bacterium]
MATPILVPSAGQTTEEAVFVAWRVTVGQTVKVGDILAELETDKALMELESYAAGQILKLMAQEGDVITAGQIIALVGEPGETCEVASTGDTDSWEESEQTSAVASGGRESVPSAAQDALGRTVATPAARTLARRRGVDLARVSGSGPGGCIILADVETLLSQNGVSIDSV